VHTLVKIKDVDLGVCYCPFNSKLLEPVERAVVYCHILVELKVTLSLKTRKLQLQRPSFQTWHYTHVGVQLFDPVAFLGERELRYVPDRSLDGFQTGVACGWNSNSSMSIPYPCHIIDWFMLQSCSHKVEFLDALSKLPKINK